MLSNRSLIVGSPQKTKMKFNFYTFIARSGRTFGQCSGGIGGHNSGGPTGYGQERAFSTTLWNNVYVHCVGAFVHSGINGPSGIVPP